ncbi:MAG: hypothetical protein EA357_00655 [Micavibrio sp.]|nr:MAG: hypothetical protein EA357_00655 [Micavibrio sp.]
MNQKKEKYMTEDEKELKTGQIVLRAMLAGFLYFLLGGFSLNMEVLPEIATPFWPAAGVALAAVLLWGNRILPGIILGSFAANMFAVYQTGVPDGNFFAHLVPAIGITCGVSLQAWLAALLVRKFVRFPNPLENFRDIALFLFLGGPLACLVSASVSVTWLRYSGVVSDYSYFFQWFTWWSGDTIGVLLAAPLFILLASPATAIDRKRKMTVALPLLAIAVTAYTVFLWIKHIEERTVEMQFEAETLAQTDTVQDSLDGLTNALHSVSGLYAASEKVTRREFDIFTSRILAQHPSIRMIKWSPRVPHDRRTAFENAAAEDGLEEFYIREMLPEHAGFRPAAERDVYFPAFFIAPGGQYDEIFGLDLAAGKSNRAVLEDATAAGLPHATPPIKLYHGGRGILVIDPIYSNIHGSAAPPEGFVTAVVDTPALIATLTRAMEAKNIRLTVTDEAAEPDMRILYSSEKTGAAMLQLRRDLRIAGRVWSADFKATPEYFFAYRPWTVWFAMAGGVVFVILTQFLLLALTGQTSATERIVAERTRALKRSNAELEQFAFAASHDLKAPLRHISICTEFIDEEGGKKLGKQARDYLGVIKDSTRRMSALIDDLLDYARIGHEEKEGDSKTRADMNEIFDSTVKDLAGVINETGGSVTRDPLPEVHGNPQLLSRLMLNLVDNALKYRHPEKPPEIHATCVMKGGYFLFAVSDNGIGIDPQFATKVFEVFQRLHNESDYPGTGIGLPACKRIIEYHKGRIWLDTDYRDGSRFCFTLPQR